MRKLFVLLIIGMFTIPVIAQQTQANLDYLRSAQKKIGAGATLTLLGAGTMIGGAVVYANGLKGIYDSSTTSTIYDNEGNALKGIAIMVVGEILFDIGLPFWIVGGVQKGRAERNLRLSLVQFQSPNNHTSINGIGLKIRF